MATLQEREIRAKELEALAAVMKAAIDGATSSLLTNMNRENFLDTAKTARDLIDDKLKDMYTHG